MPTHSVRKRFGPSRRHLALPKNLLPIFGLEAPRPALPCPVNPQVPGSSPGRGARQLCTAVVVCERSLSTRCLARSESPERPSARAMHVVDPRAWAFSTGLPADTSNSRFEAASTEDTV